MAKKEKLEALVPPEEQPYPVPENWRWVRLGGITDVVGGGTPSSSKEEYYENGDIPWISPADLSGYNDIYISCGAKNITGLGLQNSSARLMPKDTVCLSTRAPIGYVAIAQNELATNQGFKSFLPAPCYLPHYLFWFLKGNKHMLESMASGTTFLELSGSKAATIIFPLAPIREQQRIVDRIESLFAKLDEAKEKAQAAVDGFEDRKAVILHKAFTGELTEKWRNDNRKSIDEWELLPLVRAFEIKSGTTIDSSDEKSEGAIPYIKVADMNLPGNEIQIMKSSRYVDACSPSQEIPRGSTIFPKRGGAILTNKKRYVGVEKIIADLNTMAIIPIEEVIDGWYGYYWMQTVDLKTINNGSNVPQINNKDMIKLFVPKPTIQEQHEIVAILTGLLKKARKSKESSENLLSQIDDMKKSILAKAFRGELGTNDPTEPPVELS